MRFSVGQKLSRFPRSFLYRGCFLSLGYLSYDTNPLWTASADPLCVTAMGAGGAEAHTRLTLLFGLWVMQPSALWPTQPVSLHLLPSICETAVSAVSRVESWLLHSSGQALSSQVLEINGRWGKDLVWRPQPARHPKTSVLQLKCAPEPPGGFDQIQNSWIPCQGCSFSGSESLDL